LAQKYTDRNTNLAKKLKPVTDKVFGSNDVKEMIKEEVVNILKKDLLRECMNPSCERVCHNCKTRFSGTMVCPKCGLDHTQFQVREGFDPQSQAGPNITVNEPGFYDRMNAQMQRMEEGEEDSVASYERGYKDGEFSKKYHEKPLKTGVESGNRVYSTGYFDGYYGKPKADADTIRRTIKEMETSSEPHGRYAQQAGAMNIDASDYGINEMRTFQEIRDAEDPDGTKHDLTLQCVKCGTKHTCRCSKPKRLMKGICDECAMQESK